MSTANDPKAFGSRFGEALRRKGHGRIGATELADMLATEFQDGVSVQTAHKWLHGTAVPRPERLSVLAHWLGVSEHWLRFGPDPNADPRSQGGQRPLSTKDLARRLQALSDAQRQIVEALLLEFEKIDRD